MQAVVIVSGGLDSTVLAYKVVKDLVESSEDVHMLSFDYGQRHAKELEYAVATADRLNTNWNLIDLTSVTEMITSSVLTSDEPIPQGHYAEDNMRKTVVPNRNMMMLSVAIAVAVSEGAERVYAGMHSGDHYVYPDCRPAFQDALQLASDHANEGFGAPQLIFPFRDRSKADIVKEGVALRVPFRETWSCYEGGARHCGKCGTCVERAEAFFLALVDDPTVYDDKYYWRTATGLVK
jgi:7-cyano-7-deazaguanine synthase